MGVLEISHLTVCQFLPRRSLRWPEFSALIYCHTNKGKVSIIHANSLIFHFQYHALQNKHKPQNCQDKRKAEQKGLCSTAQCLLSTSAYFLSLACFPQSEHVFPVSEITGYKSISLPVMIELCSDHVS